jgi:hypothetical protein
MEDRFELTTLNARSTFWWPKTRDIAGLNQEN